MQVSFCYTLPNVSTKLSPLKKLLAVIRLILLSYIPRTSAADDKI